MRYFKYLATTMLKQLKLKLVSRRGSAAYWTSHMVTNEVWVDAGDSLDHFLWRNAQYPGYINLMPVSGADSLTVLDYGCGPGNDLVGFAEFSKPQRLIGADVSPTALKVAEQRLALHAKPVELVQLEEGSNIIPLADQSVDLVHSSGVLHHVKNLNVALMEIQRVLKPGGRLQVMIYNYDSLWLHLYTAYIHQIKMGLYSDLPLLEAFRRTTDGPHCPISHCYRPQEFLDIVCNTGFSGHYMGASISLLELGLLSQRFDAIRTRKLAREHRDFLSAISFNEFGHPLVGGYVTGINACFEFQKV